MCEHEGDRVWRYRDLRRAGLTRGAITLSVAAGSLVHLRRGVYASAGSCADVRDAALHGGTLTCVTAARHLGLWVLEDSAPHVWVRGHGHAREHDACVCVAHWDGDAPRPFLGRPTLVQVLAQILVCRGPEDFFVALESALRQGRLTAAEQRQLSRTVDAVGRDLIDFARRDADSGLESLVRLRLRHLGLPITTQASITGVGRVDLLIDGRLIVEIDGKLGHSDPRSRHRDLQRDATAAIWGLRTLRFDYAMVIHDWPTVEHTILAALA
ncbi:endonuclease domain-containing protein [Microbacterium gorillae]|uniref:endonuclease domain-containing protein n=1 Tax=Microbacterium gorillae TaxID=1231063 RepID=UPI00058B9E0D|nr:DUF559 domain-containing protein [Microbacterium gorillae]